jgi:uncharacterized protein (DUF3820 family)
LTSTSPVNLAMKLLSRSLDPNAPQPEAETSAAKFVHHCRREGVTLIDLAKCMALVAPNHAANDRPNPPPPAADIRMPFGKHGGQRLGDIARVNPGYLTWCLENLIRHDELCQAIEVVCMHYGLLEGAAA